MVVYCHVGAKYYHYCPLKCKKKGLQTAAFSGASKDLCVCWSPCRCVHGRGDVRAYVRACVAAHSPELVHSFSLFTSLLEECRAAPHRSISTPWRALQRAVRWPPEPGAGGAAGRAAALPERGDAAPDQLHHQPLLRATTHSVIGFFGGTRRRRPT